MDAGYGWERDTQTVMDASSLVGTRLVRIVTLIRSTPAKRLPRMFLFVITATIHHASVRTIYSKGQPPTTWQIRSKRIDSTAIQ